MSLQAAASPLSFLPDVPWYPSAPKRASLKPALPPGSRRCRSGSGNYVPSDYVYESEKLISLSGKKLHGKRNHINNFIKAYPDYQYERINGENREECIELAQNWRKENGCDSDPEKNEEFCVTLRALKELEDLNLTGGLIRADGRVVAFSIGEKLCNDTFVVHIEKAYADIQGAYPIINQQFVLHEAADYRYINREEDTGAEGLRKAKLSYYPVFLQEKGVVTTK